MSIRLFKIRFAGGFGFVFLSFYCLISEGQPAALDLTFNPGKGIGGGDGVYSLFVEANGQIIVGGDFSAFNQTPFNDIVRLNPDGSIDTNFFIGEGPDASLTAVA